MKPSRPLMSLDDALARVLDVAARQPIAETLSISTFEALGRVLAEDVRSTLDVPPADNTSMDGYAVRVGDLPSPGTVLPLSQRIPAGHVGQPLAPGSVARIFTGAQVPAGADAIVMQEQATVLDDGRVRIDAVPQP
jgi:molybdopterin molybdotransferase